MLLMGVRSRLGCDSRWMRWVNVTYLDVELIACVYRPVVLVTLPRCKLLQYIFTWVLHAFCVPDLLVFYDFCRRKIVYPNAVVVYERNRVVGYVDMP